MSQVMSKGRSSDSDRVSMRVTATLNLHRQLKEGAIPPAVDGVPQILHSVGSPPIEM